MSLKKYTQAMKDVVAEEMRKDPSVFYMGEDIGIMGGPYGTTTGLLEEFGEKRIRDTPISECAIVGVGLGAAMTGMRPIVDLIYMDFTFTSLDQILNQVAKITFVSGGKVKVPLVIKAQQGVGKGNGATHSQSLETIFTHIPGMKVVLPSSPADAAGLLRTAIREDNPVMFIEHKGLYAIRGEVPDNPEFSIPFGEAHVVRPGNDVTVIATLLYVDKAMKAAEKLKDMGIEVEVIDPRTLVPFDKETIIESVKKTGRAVIVQEAHKTSAFGAEISSVIMEGAFNYLDAPVISLGAKQCPLPFNLNLENAVIPQEEDIIRAVKKVLYR